jgi:hypothetical protein
MSNARPNAPPGRLTSTSRRSAVIDWAPKARSVIVTGAGYRRPDRVGRAVHIVGRAA